MGMMDSSALLSVTTRNVKNMHLDEIIDANGSRMASRRVGNNLKNSSSVTQFTQLNMTDCSRIEALKIEALKEDLMFFRTMLEQTVQQKPEKMDCYASILKSCNSTLGGNYHKMHKKYLSLLDKTQAHEAKLHLRVLEGELAMLTKNQAQELR